MLPPTAKTANPAAAHDAALPPLDELPGHCIRRLQQIAVTIFLRMLRQLVVANNALSRAPSHD